MTAGRLVTGEGERSIREATHYARVVLGRAEAIVVAAIERGGVEALALVEPGDGDPFALAWRYGDEEMEEAGAEDFYRERRAHEDRVRESYLAESKRQAPTLDALLGRGSVPPSLLAPFTSRSRRGRR